MPNTPNRCLIPTRHPSRASARSSLQRLRREAACISMQCHPMVAAVDPGKPLTALEAADEVWQELSKWAKRAAKLSAAAGVFLAFLYFVGIRYLPIESFASFGALGAVIAGISLLLFLSLLVMWALPTLLITALSTSQVGPSLTDWFRKKEAAPSSVARCGAPARGITEIQHEYAWWRVVIFCLCTTGVTWGCFSFFLWVPESKSLVTAHWQYAVMAALPVIVVLLWYIAQQRSNAPAWGPPSRWAYAGRAGWIAALSISSAYPLVVALQMFAISPVTPGEHRTAFYLFIALGIVLTLLHGLNIWLALRFQGKPRGSMWTGQILMAGSLLFLLFVLLGMPTPIFNGVMRATSVRVPHANVVLTKEACSALQREGVDISGASAMTSEGGSSVGCLLRDVLVLSRIGDRWRIACRPNATGGDDRRAFNINTSHVLSWVEVRSPADGVIDKERDICRAGK